MPSEPDLILRDMSDGVVVIDAKGRLKTINPAARALLELSDATLPGSFASLFIGDRRNDGFVQAMLDALQTTDAPGDCVTDFYTRSGQQRKVNVKATFTRADSGEKELIAVLSDVTGRENAIVFRKDVTILVAIVFLFVCLYLFIYKLLDDCWPGMVAPSTLTYGLLFALLAVSVLIWKKTSMKPRITIRGPVARKAMASGALVTVCAIVALIAVKLVMLRVGSGHFAPGAPFFNLSRFTWKELYRYLPCVLAQEFLARSVLQEGFIYVFGEKYGGLAVLTSSLVFGVVHLPYSFVMMVGASLMLGALGFFYQRNRNFFAVSLVHYCVTEAAMILGLL